MSYSVASATLGGLPHLLVLLGGLVAAVVLLQRSRTAGLLLGAGLVALLAELVLSFVWSLALPRILVSAHIGLNGITPLVVLGSFVLSALWAAGIALCLAGVFAGRRAGAGRSGPQPRPRPQPPGSPEFRYPPPQR